MEVRSKRRYIVDTQLNKMIVKKTMSICEIVILLLGIIAFASLLSSLNAPLISAADDVVAPGVTLPEEVQATDELGCCVDTNQGFCSPTSFKAVCESTENGEFYKEEFCNIEGGICDRGCCVIGIESSWVTKGTCSKQSESLGITYEFKDDVYDEFSCIGVSREAEVGACTYGIGDELTCGFTSFLECKENGGEFYKGTLCSNKDLESECEKQASTGCLDGRDEIYWFDSCGNPENIYSSNKIASWNNGMLLTKAVSCGASSANINSETCGNCDYNAGSICSSEKNDITIKDGTAICKDLNCKKAPSQVDAKGKVLATKNRINGESWCIYDGPIGGEIFGQDLIGSRHYRYVCSNGKVEVEPCLDYRQGICVEKKVEKKSTAICRVNTWEQCMAKNNEGETSGCYGECKAKCLENPDCRIQSVDIDSGFHFTACVPRYTPGFETAAASGLGSLTGEEGEDVSTTDSNGEATKTCALASQTCTSIWKKKCPGGWVCIDNCNCHSDEFTTQMNNFCVSLGDCGVFANVMGKPILSGSRVIKDGSHGDVPMQPALMGIAYMSLSRLPSMKPINGGIYDDVKDILGLGQGRLIGITDPFLGNIGKNKISKGEVGGQIAGLFSSDQVGATVGFALLGGAVGAGAAFAIPAAGAAISAAGTTAVTTIGVSSAVLGGTSAAPMAIVPVTSAAVAGGGSGAGGGAAAAAGTAAAGVGAMAVFAGVAIAIVLVIVIMYLSGCGKYESVEIQFKCSPSGAPLKDNCEACDGGELKPCSKYKCESLGATCRIVNDNTEDAACISIKGFIGAPMISPNEDVLNKTMFLYKDVSNNGFKLRKIDDGCVDPFTPISLGVVTSSYAKCRVGEKKAEFEELTGSFLEGEIFSINHTMILTMPSVDAMAYSSVPVPDNQDSPEDQQAYQDALSEAYFQAKKVAQDVNYYVKCMSPTGEENVNDYKINFCINPSQDLTPPAIVGMSPISGEIVSYSAETKDAIIYLTEPSECKWGTTNPNLGDLKESYNALPNEMICKIDGSSTGLLAYYCIANLTINSTENNFYFQCKDQPWLGENDSRNIGNIFPYSLTRSESELEIDSIEPEGEIVSGVEPLTLSIDAKTSGGGYSGASTCKYKISTAEFPGSSFIRFLDTKTDLHNQPGLQFLSGDYNIDVKCIDQAGNVAEKGTKISLKLDSTPPTVARAFKEGTGLKLLTNEQATCFYAFSGCNFKTEEGIEIVGGKSTEHILDWNPDSAYYVRCEDAWGNAVSGCSIIVRPSQL